MMFVAALMTLAFSPERPETPFEQVTPQVAAERVSQCGLGTVTISYDELLQSDVLTSAGATSVSVEQLACADRAVSYYQLELPPALQPRYDAIRAARLAAHARVEARAWLAERGMLERLPRYEAGVTDEGAFTRQLERLCGPRAEGAFQSEYGFHAISPDWARRTFEPFEDGAEALTCLMKAAFAAGFEIGFVGNEAASNQD
jgi:hypothetical protein